MIHTNNNFLFLGSVYFEPHGNEWAHKIGGHVDAISVRTLQWRSDKPLNDGSFEITLV